MENGRIVALPLDTWESPQADTGWIEALEAGKVLYFFQLMFALSTGEQALLEPELLADGVRNISMDAHGRLKGVVGTVAAQAAVRALISRFAMHAALLVNTLFPGYGGFLRPAPTSLRPMQVATRQQSWRADDRRLHVDAFPSRPNRGERILRVFSNLNPRGESRDWRVGESFEEVVKRFGPELSPYSPLKAKLLHKLHVTKSLRSEYDHMMLQLHDRMKSDERYQREAPQQSMAFPAGSTWICFSDQTVHAAMGGQHMIEQTFHLPVDRQYNPQASPLAILTRFAGHPLI